MPTPSREITTLTHPDHAAILYRAFASIAELCRRKHDTKTFGTVSLSIDFKSGKIALCNIGENSTVRPQDIPPTK